MVDERPRFARLKSIATIRPGVNKPKEAMGSGVRYVTVQDLYDGTSVNPMSLPRVELSGIEIEKFCLKPGDIVICKSSVKREGIGYASRFLGCPEPVAHSGFTACVRSRPEVVFSDFLFHALRWSQTRQWLIRYSQQSAITNLNRSLMEAIPVPLIPLPEQRKIAAILSSVDDAIEKTQAVIDQVQVVKRGLMQELLTRGLPGRHTRFKQTEIGEIPEDWDARSIDALVISCDYGTSDALRNDGIGVPVLRMGNLQDGRVSLEDVKYIAADKVPDEFLLSEGDVLFNRTNSADLVGKVAAFEHQRKVSFASYLLRLRVEPRQGNGYWLSYLLNTPELQKKLRSTATPGVSQVNISRRSLLATVVPVPSVEEQATIVSMLDSIEQRIETEKNRVDQLTAIKSALMSVLLTGELRVTPDTEAA